MRLQSTLISILQTTLEQKPNLNFTLKSIQNVFFDFVAVGKRKEMSLFSLRKWNTEEICKGILNNTQFYMWETYALQSIRSPKIYFNFFRKNAEID